MCFGAPYQYAHMDRHTDATDTIHAFHTCSYNLSYPKCCADPTRLYTIFGLKYGYLLVLSLLDPHRCCFCFCSHQSINNAFPRLWVGPTTSLIKEAHHLLIILKLFNGQFFFNFLLLLLFCLKCWIIQSEIVTLQQMNVLY